jgi:hypothetical protein
VHVTPRGIWGATGPAALTTLRAWLGSEAAPVHRFTIDDLVLRYIAAFGPVSVMDIQLWSGLTKLREVVERQDLRSYRTDDNRELFDVPGGLLPHPDSPAPVRFLPEYDNALLSHADRSRIIEDGRPVPLPPGNGARAGTLLAGGFYQGDWKITNAGDDATLTVTLFRPLTPAERDEIAVEARQLLSFLAPDTDHDLQITQSPSYS